MLVSHKAFSIGEEAKKGGTAKYFFALCRVILAKGFSVFTVKIDSHIRKEFHYEENAHARQRGRGQRTL
jgi:hypothetical protein